MNSGVHIGFSSCIVYLPPADLRGDAVARLRECFGWLGACR